MEDVDDEGKKGEKGRKKESRHSLPSPPEAEWQLFPPLPPFLSSTLFLPPVPSPTFTHTKARDTCSLYHK